MTWVWSKLSAVKWMDAWEERFYGNPNSVVSVLKGGKRLRVEVFCETAKEAEDLKVYWGGSVRELPNRDWVAASAEVKPPLKIRDRVVVTMLGDGEELGKLREEFAGRVVISVPPEMAFGTGDHPTTATCLRILADEAEVRKGGEWSFLDLGSGSGLLGIAARHLGAKEVVGVDYDGAAVAVAQRNVERNGVPEVRMEEGDVFEWEPGGQYEVVAANLFADVLRGVMERMVQWVKPGGVLMVSGILAEQWDSVCQSGTAVGVRFGEPIRRGKWVTCRGVFSGGGV